jgi:uncharacterized UBP type Zn finger protein
MDKEECVQCGSKEKLMKAKDEDGKHVLICGVCFESTCEGYELR